MADDQITRPDTPILAGTGLTLSFGDRTVLDHVDVTVHRGEIVTLIGPNGAGKTSLVRVLLGLQRADGGRVQASANLKIGYMPQKVEVDRTLPITVERFLRLAGSANAIAAALETVGVPALRNTMVADISGGEMQRVLLARALLRNPDLLVLDEPTQGVDVTGQAQLYRIIGDIRRNVGCGVLMVSHDLHLVMAATDRVVCLNHHVCCAGHPEAVSRDPAYVNLFGAHAAGQLALYQHQHDHDHDAHGDVVDGDIVHGPGAQGHHHG